MNSVSFFRSGGRPTRIEMVRYVDAYRDQFGAWLICRVLGNTAGGFMTSRGYRAAKSRPLSDRALRDQILGDEMERLHAENYGVYGVRKMYYLMRRQGWLVGTDQVARVMKTRGIAGVKRGKTTFTTKTKTSDSNPLDRVQRQFVAERPKPPGNREIRRLLVADAIGQVHGDSRGTYGYRRAQAALRIERDLTVNHKLVAKVMADLGLTGLPRKKTRKRNLIGVRNSSDLVNRNFTANQPNQLWVTDIAEHPTT